MITLALLAILLIPSGKTSPATPAAPSLSAALTVETVAGRVRVETSTSSPVAAPQTTHLRAGATPTIRWAVRNLDSKQYARRIAVHFVVAHASAHTGVPVPNSRDNTIECALGTDLAPREATTGEYHTPIEDPGKYVLTLEIRTPDGKILQACTVGLSVE